MLYHVLLAPFTIGDLRIGGKVAAVAGAFAFVGTFVWVLRRAGVDPSASRSWRSAPRRRTCSSASA